jgi:capsular exopolysaccharide synthesis family protein
MLEKQLRAESQNIYASSGESVMTVEDIFRIIRRRKKGIILSIVLSFTGAFLYHFIQVPEYHAETILMINNNEEQQDLFSKVIGPDSGLPVNQSVKKDAELILSMPIAEKTIRELISSEKRLPLELLGNRPYLSPLAMLFRPVIPLFAVHRPNEGMRSDEMFRQKAIELNKRIRVEPIRDTNVLKVSVASPYPEEAALLTNTLCRVYRDADISRNSEKYAQANLFIAEMLEEQQRKVFDADSTLSKYMSTHDIYEVTGNTQQLLEKLVETDARYNEVIAEYNITKNNLEFLDAKLSEVDKELSMRIAKSVGEQLGAIMEEMRVCENEYVRIVKEKGPDASESNAKRMQLDNVKARYEQLSRSKIAGQIGYAGRAQKYSFDMVSEKLQIERKLNELNFSAKEFSRLRQYYESQLERLPNKEQEYVKLQRDREAVSKTYVFLKEKLDESRILLGSEVGTVSIVGPAFKPIKPDSPNMKKTMLLGLLFGGVIAVVYTYGVESLDDTIKDGTFFRDNKLGRVFMIPFFSQSVDASSSKIKNSNKYTDNVTAHDISGNDVSSISLPMITENLTSPLAESIRMLRTHLDYSVNGNKQPQSFLVSGSTSKDGTSTICANLGIAYAMAGRRTLIVDADFLHASQHIVFNCEKDGGLSDYLNGSAQSVDPGLIHQTYVDNLFLLSAGKTVGNHSELLASSKMQVLFNVLKEHYDTLLFDAPPLFLSDSVRLAQIVDGILLVTSLGHTGRKPIMQLAMDEFYKSRILGVAVIDMSGSGLT